MSIGQTFRQLLFPVFLPTLLSFISLRASLVLLPLYVINQGYGPTLAGLIISIRGIGMLCADVPGGFLVSKIGDKWGMITGHLMAGLALILFALFEQRGMFVGAALISGAAFAVMMLARLSYVGEKCEAHERGRVIASMASLQRIGGILGPLGGGLIATWYGFVPALYLLALLSLLSALTIFVYCDNNLAPEGETAQSHAFIATIKANRAVFSTSGAGAIGLMCMRGASPLLITLFGNAIALSAAQIGFFASMTTILEFVMFLPGGYIMDRWGRKNTLIPGTLFMAFSLVILVLFPSLEGYVAGILLMALGNGLATGVIMSIGSDLAPEKSRGQFLGVWRFVCDLGFTGGPLFVTGLMGVCGLAGSSLALGALASGLVIYMGIYAPESLKRHPEK